MSLKNNVAERAAFKSLVLEAAKEADINGSHTQKRNTVRLIAAIMFKLGNRVLPYGSQGLIADVLEELTGARPSSVVLRWYVMQVRDNAAGLAEGFGFPDEWMPQLLVRDKSAA